MARPLLFNHLKSCDLTNSTIASDSLEHNMKYMNLNFIDNSESSSQAKDVEDSNTPSPPRTTKRSPSKILPPLPFPGRNELKKPQKETGFTSKDLIEMGFISNEIVGWENMN